MEREGGEGKDKEEEGKGDRGGGGGGGEGIQGDIGRGGGSRTGRSSSSSGSRGGGGSRRGGEGKEWGNRCIDIDREVDGEHATISPRSSRPETSGSSTMRAGSALLDDRYSRRPTHVDYYKYIDSNGYYTDYNGYNSRSSVNDEGGSIGYDWTVEAPPDIVMEGTEPEGGVLREDIDRDREGDREGDRDREKDGEGEGEGGEGEDRDNFPGSHVFNSSSSSSSSSLSKREIQTDDRLFTEFQGSRDEYGARNGYGEYDYVNGDRYIGEFVEGVRQGRGRLYSKEGGTWYDGQWEGGLKHGIGKLYMKNAVSEGRFERGSLERG